MYRKEGRLADARPSLVLLKVAEQKRVLSEYCIQKINDISFKTREVNYLMINSYIWINKKY
jgi:hypothetical protein